MFSKTLVINLILTAFILLGTWYTWLQLTHPVSPFTTGHQPDTYATQVVIYHTDQKGNLYDQLDTPLSVHYPLDDSISLSAPFFTLFLKNRELWQLSSRYGKLEEGKNILRLWDNVKLTQKQGSSNTPLSTLTTSTLNIHLKDKTAQTSAPVVINQVSQEIHAIGLHADFNSKTIRLLSQVKGQLKSAKK